ncbi:MAG: hypothetical protein M3P04_07210 [Actinomycetota bacterium]|nr:hypothetical protein [Actinomycetota bacterium]
MPRDSLRARLALVVAVAALLGSAPAASARPSRYRTTPVSGSWFVTGCVPTKAPSGVGFPMTLEARCVGEVTGGWTGYYTDDERGTEDSTLSMHLRGVLTLYGTASDGTCGSLRIATRTETDGSTDVEHSTGTIVGGTGDWAGSRGTYRTTGQFDTAEGNGDYQGSWLRPRSAPQGRSSPCLPPTPAP